MSMPPEKAPPEILKAALDFVRVVNKHGARCVGAVIVIVFEETNRVIPIIDPNMQPIGGSSPAAALLEEAIAGLESRLEALRFAENEQEPN